MFWWLIGGLVLGGVVTWILLRPKLKVTEEINQKVKKENEANLAMKTRLIVEVTNLEDQASKAEQSLNSAIGRLSEVDKALEERLQSAETYNNKMIEGLNESFEIAAEKKREEYNKAAEEAKLEQERILADLNEAVEVEMASNEKTITDSRTMLENLQKKVNAITEANRRLEEEKDKQNFYKLQISDIDLEEISKLRELGKVLRDSTPLNKLIWTYQFRNPYNELCGRVVGTTTKTGIYKLTNQLDGKVYIGQSVNIKDRWGTHIKMGLGAETPSRNKLYPAMQKDGVENFTFEILEECASGQLNEREKFYIDFYGSADYGYNATRGGS